MMKKKLLALVLAHFLFTVNLSGCAGHVRFKSNPENAKVELMTNDSRGLIPLGETPLMVESQSAANHQVTGPYIFRISKPGFTTREIVISSLNGTQIDYNVELKKEAITQAANQLIDDLFVAQYLAQKGNYNEALVKLEGLQAKYPEIAAVYEMKGSVHMLRGQYDLAIQHFNQALKLNPENAELAALRETALLRGESKTRRISSEVQPQDQKK